MLRTILITMITFVNVSNAQHLWYENETNTDNTQFDRSHLGTFSINNENPEINGINTNSKVSKFVRNKDVTKGFTYFKLFNAVETAADYIINFKAFIDVATADLGTTNTPDRIRVYFRNSTNNEFFQDQLKFEVGQEWQEFTFNINSSKFTEKGLSEGGYDEMSIGYGNGQDSATEITYYLDSIYGSTEQKLMLNSNIEWMSGSWGARLYVRGGGTLDNFVNDGYDYVAGAEEIVNTYSTIGHVITNATNNAKSYLFTLRTNENLDAVMGAPNSIITEEFVPSIENEQVIIDVIKVFKDAGKKVILYLNTMDPAERSSAEGAVAWNAYVDQYFNGNVHLAWMNLCEGYVKRFAELGVDGYWLDAFSSYPGNNKEKAAYIQMFRDVDPNLIITANLNKTYFEDENGEVLVVDTDDLTETIGTNIDGNIEEDYRIIKLDGNDPYSDFTPGHITPLAQGAPPNSWAYEEFTIPDIQDSPTSSYDGSKLTLKHLFMPIRTTWSSARSPLVYDNEQAYRFVKRITDAGGSITFSNTIKASTIAKDGTILEKGGTVSEDEDVVMKYVNEQMLANATPTEYSRPEGAYLVGEPTFTEFNANSRGNKDSLEAVTVSDITIYPNPVNSTTTIVNAENSTIYVYNMNGSVVFTKSISSENELIDLSVLSKGMYYGEVKGEDTLSIIKIIKE